MTARIIVGDCREKLKELADNSVHCCVCSPPYFGLRDYGVEGQIGLEETLDAFIAEMVAVFQEVRRVLRADGTLWLNLGDSYAGSGRGGYAGGKSTLEGTTTGQDMSHVARGSQKPAGLHEASVEAGALGRAWVAPPAGLKGKDLMGVPWRVAFALQADGWWLRQDIIWAKPNPMPESVRDRCTKAHEYLFLLSKSERYFYDADAIAEPAGADPGPGIGGWAATSSDHSAVAHAVLGTTSHGDLNKRTGRRKNSFARTTKDSAGEHGQKPQFRPDREPINYEGRRNKRSVWTVATEAFKEAHFATYPQTLIEPCILAGVPAQCCTACGAPWARITEKHLVPTKKAVRTAVVDQRDHGADAQDQGSNRQKDGHRPGYVRADVTLGFEPTCDCGAATGGGRRA